MRLRGITSTSGATSGAWRGGRAGSGATMTVASRSRCYIGVEGQAVVLSQDCGFQGPQLLARLEPQLVAQGSTNVW